MDSKDEALQRMLQETYRIEPPRPLRQRLLDIAEEVPQPAEAQTQRARATRRKGRHWLNFQWRLAVPAMAAAAAIAVLWGGGIRMPTHDALQNAGAPSATTVEQQAVRDFVIVMNYLQASTVRINREVNAELGAGLMTAFERGEQSFRDSSNRITNGG